MNSGRLRPQGYTIVEVMIFLVITGSLMASALAVFRGQQGRVQFTQGVRETESQIKTVVNEVTSGYYPNKDSIVCTNVADKPQFSFDAADDDTQGESEDCIFLGKVIQFTSGDNYKVFTLVGLRQTGSPSVHEATTLVDARPSPIASTDASKPDVTEQFTLPYGLTVTAVLQQNDSPLPPTEIGSVGFIMSLGAYGAGGGDLLAGSQSTNLMPLESSGLNDSKADIISKIENKLAGSETNPGNIVVCLKSGSDDKRAAIVIGNNNSQLSTQTVIDDNTKLDGFGCPA